MASNVTLPAQGTGDSTPLVATEQISTAHYQKIKVIDATATSTTGLKVTASAAASGDAGAVVRPIDMRTPNGDTMVNDTNDSLKVEVVSNLTTGGTLDTDDGTVAKSQSNVALNICIPYTDDGSANMTRTGCSINRLIGAGTTNATSVKASAGAVYNVLCSNINASPVYLKLYNKASAPTVGTDTPVMTLLVPGSTTGAGMAFDASNINGVPFATGIAFALTGAVGDADTTAVSANQQVVHVFYK